MYELAIVINFCDYRPTLMDSSTLKNPGRPDYRRTCMKLIGKGVVFCRKLVYYPGFKTILGGPLNKQPPRFVKGIPKKPVVLFKSSNCIQRIRGKYNVT